MEQYKYKLVQTTRFRKELKKIKKQYKEKAKAEFEYVVTTLLKGEKLPEKYRNHLLEPKSKRIL